MNGLGSEYCNLLGDMAEMGTRGKRGREKVDVIINLLSSTNINKRRSIC